MRICIRRHWIHLVSNDVPLKRSLFISCILLSRCLRSIFFIEPFEASFLNGSISQLSNFTSVISTLKHSQLKKYYLLCHICCFCGVYILISIIKTVNILLRYLKNEQIYERMIIMTNDQLLNSNVEPRVMTAEEILEAHSFRSPPQNPPHVERVNIKKILLYSFYACFALYVLYLLFRFFFGLNKWFFTRYFCICRCFFIK